MPDRCHSTAFLVRGPGVVECCPGCPDCPDTIREVIEHRRGNGLQTPVTTSEEGREAMRLRERRLLRQFPEKGERVGKGGRNG